jgi:hypothetical protein
MNSEIKRLLTELLDEIITCVDIKEEVKVSLWGKLEDLKKLL